MKKKQKEEQVVEQQVVQPQVEQQEVVEEPILNENPDEAIDPESVIKEEEHNEINELKTEIDKLKTENKDLIEKIKYSQAELVAYRMRKDEETQSMLKYANQDLIMEIIPLIDNFENAIKLASKSENPEIAKYLTGFQMMYTNLLAVLNKYGVEVIDRAGQVFDSKLEQALVAENNPDLADEVVIEVLQKGYKLKDRVIRPASVKINQI